MGFSKSHGTFWGKEEQESERMEVLNKKFRSKADFAPKIWRRGWDSNPCDVAVKLISSQPRYDHFDTSPCMFQSAFIFAQISLRKLLERKAGEKTGKYSIFHFEIPYISRIPGKQNCQADMYSESRLFWPLRYRSEASILYNTEIRFASTKFRLNNIIERHAGLSPMSIPVPIPIPALKCVYPIRQASSPHWIHGCRRWWNAARTAEFSIYEWIRCAHSGILFGECVLFCILFLLCSIWILYNVFITLLIFFAWCANSDWQQSRFAVHYYYPFIFVYED